MCLTLSFSAAAASIDTNQLPPAARVTVDFERDIKPILEPTCWRCHGPERPRSHFRLDNRESALKGGDNGTDILPGNSAGSPLIHYVSRLVPDMEMPPEGKGQPLTPEQIGLLRAWIDQGLSWSVTNPPVQLAFSASPTLRVISVEGNRSKFREVEGLKEGSAGGLEHFSMQEQISPDEKFSVEGRALFPDHDIQLKLALEKADVGFVRGGFEVWRRYYADTGGYYQPLAVPSFNLDRELHLDIGRAWIDLGLALPRWPAIVLGYEYQFRDGAKSTLEWGAVISPGSVNHIYPASENIREQVHILKFDLTHDYYDWRLADSLRVEFYDDQTQHHDALGYTIGPAPDVLVQSRQGSSYIQAMNTVRLERQIADGLFFSSGYLYSHFDGNNSFDQTTTDALGTPVSGTFWSSDQIRLERELHSFSVAGLAQPWEKVYLSAGAQTEWTRQQGFGNVQFDEGNPDTPQSFLLEPATISSDYDTRKLTREVSARTTVIPWTVLFAEGRWAQESVSQSQDQVGNEAAMGGTAFMTQTDFTHDTTEYRVGFNSSPWSRVDLSAHYKRTTSDTDFQNQSIPIANEDYSAFIRSRNIDTDEAQTKLALRPANWLKLALTYQFVQTDYRTATSPALGPPLAGSTTPDILSPGGPIFSGTYRARVYGLYATLTPFQRFYFSGTFTFSDSRASTAQNNDPSIVPFKGNVYTLVASANYALDKSTDLRAAYSFSQADYGQNNVADGLPLGLNYARHGLMAGVTRRLTARLTANLRYNYYRYYESNTGGFNDYTAQGVFATLVFKWP